MSRSKRNIIDEEVVLKKKKETYWDNDMVILDDWMDIFWSLLLKVHVASFSIGCVTIGVFVQDIVRMRRAWVYLNLH